MVQRLDLTRNNKQMSFLVDTLENGDNIAINRRETSICKRKVSQNE